MNKYIINPHSLFRPGVVWMAVMVLSGCSEVYYSYPTIIVQSPPSKTSQPSGGNAGKKTKENSSERSVSRRGLEEEPEVTKSLSAQSVISKPNQAARVSSTSSAPSRIVWQEEAFKSGKELETAAMLLPSHVSNRKGWALDIVKALKAKTLDLEVNSRHVCAVIAVIGQESSFQVDPVVPGLSRIAWRLIEEKRRKLHIPESVLNEALSFRSTDGRTYRERIDTARTENDLSRIFEELTFGILGRFNPIRTGGPMQVSVAFSEDHAGQKPYPYAQDPNIRREVFTRRGGIYFGVAHLLDYPAPYVEMRYRFADYNAGRFSSRNAAFQKAVASLSGTSLTLDGDLAPETGVEQGETYKLVSGLTGHLRMEPQEIASDLKLEKTAQFSNTLLYKRVFELVDGTTPEKRAARAVIPDIRLHGPKIQREISTAWFTEKVNQRFRDCMGTAEVTVAPSLKSP